MGIERIIDPKERERAHAEVGYVDFYSEAVKQSEEFREEYDGYLNVVKSAQMPLERSPDGLLKHIIHEKMKTKEMCLDIYMHFIPAGKRSRKSLRGRWAISSTSRRIAPTSISAWAAARPGSW